MLKFGVEGSVLKTSNPNNDNSSNNNNHKHDIKNNTIMIIKTKKMNQKVELIL